MEMSGVAEKGEGMRINKGLEMDLKPSIMIFFPTCFIRCFTYIVVSFYLSD